MVLLRNGEVWSWGWNEHGNCGTDPSAWCEKKKIIPEAAIDIFTGYAHSFVKL